LNGIWHLKDCRYHFFRQEEVVKLLAGKRLLLVGDSQMRHMKAAIDTLQCNCTDGSADKSKLVPTLKHGETCPNGRSAAFGPVFFTEFAGHTVKDLRMLQHLGCQFFERNGTLPDIIVLNTGQHPLSRNPMSFYEHMLNALASALKGCRKRNDMIPAGLKESFKVIWRETSIVYKTDTHNNFNEADRVRLANYMAKQQLASVVDAVLPIEAISDAYPEGLRYDHIHFTNAMDEQIVNILWTYLASSSPSPN
jgi:hypothetical protein